MNTPPPPDDNPLPQGACTCGPRDKEACPQCRAMIEWCLRELERAGQQRIRWEEEEQKP